MSTGDIVSIIAPAYNHEKYIWDALSSIARQTYYNKQLIVIDDCSQDKTAQRIEEYIGRPIINELFPAGIIFIKHEKNQNAHRTINEGIQQASGKYISIINTDDQYEDNRLEVMISALKHQNKRLAFSKVSCIDENGSYIENKTFTQMKENLCNFPTPSFALALENAAIGTGNYIFEKTLYEEVGGFNAQYHFIHDWDFILKTALICEPLFAEGTTYLYRFHASNTIKQISQSQETEREKDWEVTNVLTNFLQEILMGTAQNEILQDIALWNYFFELFPEKYCSYLWKQLSAGGANGV